MTATRLVPVIGVWSAFLSVGLVDAQEGTTADFLTDTPGPSAGSGYEREVFRYPVGNRPDPFRSLLLDSDLGIRLEDLTLRGTVYHSDPSLSVAIISQEGADLQIRARAGEQFGPLRVVAIHPDRVDVLIEELGVVRRESLYLVRPERAEVQ